MKKTVSENLEKSAFSLRTSWQWVRTDFREDFERLCREPQNLTADGPGKVIWQTKNKYVLLLTMPESGRKVVYKTAPNVKRAYQYCHRRSVFANEAWYFCYFAELGLPMAKLLAAGDTRENFILQTGFLMTEFAEGFNNGLMFIKDDADAKLRDIYIRKNLEYLALIHDRRILHRGATPANFLCRMVDDEMQIIWIDVATCHYKPFCYPLKKGIILDLVMFLRWFPLKGDELRTYLEYYLACTKKKRFLIETLYPKVEKLVRLRVAIEEQKTIQRMAHIQASGR